MTGIARHAFGAVFMVEDGMETGCKEGGRWAIRVIMSFGGWEK
jgi:hypothetical protein